jgi:hypothetical protein
MADGDGAALPANDGPCPIFDHGALCEIPAIGQLTERGARFIPWRLEDGRKLPLQPNGWMADTTRPETWAKLGDCLDAIERLKASGVGFVLASHLDEASGHAIVVGIDLDGCRDPLTDEIKPWAQTLVEEFRTYTEVSPSGTGLKLYGTIDRPIELAAHKLVIQPDNGAKAQQLEVYTTARYFALTGAHLDSTPDELCDVTEAFERLAYRLNESACERAKDLPKVKLSGAVELTERVKKLIRDDPAVARLWRGQKRSGDTSASGLDASLALLLHRRGCSQDEIEAALRAYPHGQIGTDKLTGRMAERRLQRLIGFAMATKEDQARDEPQLEEAGADAASPKVEQGWEARLAEAIDEMNGRYFVARMGGRGVIGSLVYDDVLKRERLVFSRKEDIKLLYSSRHYQVGFSQKGYAIWKDLGTAWLENPRRRTYDRIALLPNETAPPNVYNLWRGWGEEPKAGGWPTIKAHLLEVICAGNQAHFNYLEGWLAVCVQHPEQQAGVAVVLRGLKEAGKGTLGQILLRIFRNHALHISHGRHLTGHFNAHLVDVLFLFVDEAFWGGDKQGEGVLKALITEPSIMIEPKGIDPFAMPNRLKLLIASNNDWVVPATADERRYFVLDVSEHRRRNRAYFKALYAAIEGDELPAFLHHLLSYDLARFEVRDVPHTDGLNEQKLLGADSVTKFWHDCLREGAIVGTGESDWPESVVTQVLHACYVEHARDHGERHPASDWQMAQKLQDLWKGCSCRRHRPRGQSWTNPVTKEVTERPQRYQLDSLEKHRAAFLQTMGIDPGRHSWPEVEE